MLKRSLVAMLLLLSACAGAAGQGQATPDAGVTELANGARLTLPPEFKAELYIQGLQNPTALAFGPDGRLYVTQLNGGENAGAGQVLALAGTGAAPVAVLENLFKPTGLAWRGSELFVAAGQDLLRSSLGRDGKLTQPVAVVADLPFNGRSEGQVTLLPDNRILFAASGSINDPDSGRLWTLDTGGQQVQEALGLKNAYGHAVDPASGALFTSEIGDDPMNGAAPPDEINLVLPGASYGWPRCYDLRTAALDRGGSAELCANTEAPLVTFPPHSTPTGLAFYSGNDFPDGYRGALYVALWNGQPPTVQRVTLSEQEGRTVGSATTFIGGLQRPIALLPDNAGGLLVLDQQAGAIYRVRQRGEKH